MNIIMNKEDSKRLKDYVKMSAKTERQVSSWVRDLIESAISFEKIYSMQAASFLNHSVNEPKFARIIINRKIKEEK